MEKLAGILIMLGAAGVVIISGIYGAAPHLASVPLPANVDMHIVLETTLNARLFLQLAGNIGLLADILLVAGALLILRTSLTTLGILFWNGILASTFLFVLVDGLAAFILPKLAEGAMLEGFSVARYTFDFFFAFGVLIFGLAFLCRGIEMSGKARAVSLSIFVAASIGFALFVMNITQPLLLGLGVGGAGIYLVFIGMRLRTAS
ncbi:MAG: hypothetical protein V3V13_07365 [Paracoccaceae bacterium]